MEKKDAYVGMEVRWKDRNFRSWVYGTIVKMGRRWVTTEQYAEFGIGSRVQMEFGFLEPVEKALKSVDGTNYERIYGREPVQKRIRGISRAAKKTFPVSKTEEIRKELIVADKAAQQAGLAFIYTIIDRPKNGDIKKMEEAGKKRDDANALVAKLSKDYSNAIAEAAKPKPKK